jgi:hypothetical protein
MEGESPPGFGFRSRSVFSWSREPIGSCSFIVRTPIKTSETRCEKDCEHWLVVRFVPPSFALPLKHEPEVLGRIGLRMFACAALDSPFLHRSHSH